MSNPIYEFGAFRLDPAERLLLRAGAVVPLTPKSFDLLVYLVERHGRLIEKQALLSALWPDAIVEEANLASNVSALRKALDNDSDGESVIQTVPTKGYRFVGAVQTVTSAQGVPSIAAPAIDAPPAQRRNRRLGYSVAATLGLASLVLVWRLLQPPTPQPGLIATVASPRLVRLTSLLGIESFPALSPDGEQVAFAWDENGGEPQNLYVKAIGSSEIRRLTTGHAIDSHPTWSPDGRRIAFLRTDIPGTSGVAEPAQPYVFVVPALGGPSRRVSDFPARGRVAWSKDGRFILAGRHASDDRRRGIFAISADGAGLPRALISATAPVQLFAVAVAPDGGRMGYAFCRQEPLHGEYGYGMSDCDVRVVDVNGDLTVTSEPKPLTRMPVLGGLSWTRDGRGVVFRGDEDGAGTLHLWRAAAEGERSVERIEVAGIGVGLPSTSPSSDRLVFSRLDSDIDIYRFQSSEAPTPFASSSSDDEFPAWSNDGRQIAFASDRTGSMEVWVASSDGSAVRQLTSGPNYQQRAPRWSPDDKRIAFESQGADGHFHVWVTDVNAGPPRQVTIGVGDQSGPTWSQDGRWIYFSADTRHGFDIWRVREGGGPAEQVTHGGSGYVAFESFDGKNILYQQKTTSSALVLQPLAGGPPRQVVACASADVFTMNTQGVYYVPCNPGPDAPLHVLDPVTSKDRVVGTLVQLDMATQADLAVSPDGSTVLYSRRAIADRADLWMIEHFK